MESQAPSIDTGLKAGVIHKTTDYNKFMYMGGNRTVDVKHVKELMAQMRRNREMFASLPILVNQDFYIVDGQHRYEAAKALELPIYYIVQPRASLQDARQLNIAQKRWGLKDFAKSYADSGRRDYLELLRVNEKYPRIPLSTVAQYLGNTRGGGRWSDMFRRGEYQIIDQEDGVSCLDVLARTIRIVGKPVTGAFAAALWQALHHEEFDDQAFLRKLEEKPDDIVMSNSTRGCLRSIEDVFNKHNSITRRLY